MAYIIVVNPAILEAAGIPFGPSMVATIISAAFGTLLMGLYARRPFAIAPYMGENAFVAYTIMGRCLQYPRQARWGRCTWWRSVPPLLTLEQTPAVSHAYADRSGKDDFLGVGLFITSPSS